MRCLAFEMLRQCRREDCRRFVLMYAGIAPSFHSPRLRPFERERGREREGERGRERERESSREEKIKEERENKIQCQVGRKEIKRSARGSGDD